MSATEFKARTVTLVRKGDYYHLRLPRAEANLIPPMCPDWEKVTGMKLENGTQVNIKLHVELCGKIRPHKFPSPPPQAEPEPEPQVRAQEPIRPSSVFTAPPGVRVPPFAHEVARLYNNALAGLHPRHLEILSEHLIRELIRAHEEARYYHDRESMRDLRYQELRHRDPGALDMSFRVDDSSSY